MARRRQAIRRRASSVRRAIGRRRPKRNDAKRYAKKAAIGTAAGLAVSIPLSLAAKHFNMPQLVEVASRGGAVAASALGGTPGQLGYQVADALFDRFVVFNGNNISGGSQVYL